MSQKLLVVQERNKYNLNNLFSSLSVAHPPGPCVSTADDCWWLSAPVCQSLSGSFRRSLYSSLCRLVRYKIAWVGQLKIDSLYRLVSPSFHSVVVVVIVICCPFWSSSSAGAMCASRLLIYILWRSSSGAFCLALLRCWLLPVHLTFRFIVRKLATEWRRTNTRDDDDDNSPELSSGWLLIVYQLRQRRRRRRQGLKRSSRQDDKQEDERPYEITI